MYVLYVCHFVVCFFVEHDIVCVCVFLVGLEKRWWCCRNDEERRNEGVGEKREEEGERGTTSGTENRERESLKTLTSTTRGELEVRPHR